MGENSKIEWTDHTFNPWIGCTKVSPGCQNCYAEALSKRYGKDVWGPGRPRQRTSEGYWRAPLKWDRDAGVEGLRRRVFCASMADVFDEAVGDIWRRELFALIARTINLEWLVLTKRPAVAAAWTECYGPNVWIGTSVEDQKRLELRVPALLLVPARITFLSCEPLLGPLDLESALVDGGVDWVIVGGESGPGARPMDLAWARDIREQCARVGVAYFFKQLGGAGHDKGGALESIPPDLRIRQFPSVW
jgi:protein gp37